jgi:hypothetical protein
MKSSHLITLVLTFATIGLSLPAHADQAVVNESNQTAIITGSNNSINQSNSTTVRDRANSRRGSNTGTVIRNNQTADVAGDGNTVNQTNRTQVDNRRQGR